ncbi:MAG: radical SAM protein [Desulfobacterota bacterium]|nr:radical SAM protein [Thermodesulfobacteriota bacterium]
MRICLVFPPISDPRGPHLAPAALAARLRQAGHHVTLKDLDLVVAEYFLSPAVLGDYVRRAEEQLAALNIHGPHADWKTLAWRQKISYCLEQARAIIPRISDHIDVLRSEAFYNASRFHAARRALDACLALISACFDYELNYKIDGQVFVTRYREDRVAELLQAVNDPDANPFLKVFEYVIRSEFENERFDLIGISILNYQQIIPGLTLARLLHRAGMRVVIGGTVYSKFVDQLERCADFFTLCGGVVVYEGETALVRLAEELEQPVPDLSSVPNLIWHDGTSVRVNRPFVVENLETLPTPDFTGLPLDRYFAPAPVLPYNLGKGCYWNKCLFCEIPHINNLPGTQYRIKSARLIVDQLEELSERFGTPYFQFTDESCAPALLEEITDIIISRKLSLYYLCYARLEAAFTEQLLKKLYKGGLRKLMFGLESGSDRTLQAINKGITALQAVEVLRNCQQAGVNFRLFVILGFPGETIEDAWETRTFLRNASPLLRDPLNSFEVNLFHLDPRSCFGRYAEKFGIRVTEREPGEFYLGSDRFTCPGSMDKRTLHAFIKEVREEMYELTRMREKHSGWEEYSLLTTCRHKP